MDITMDGRQSSGVRLVVLGGAIVAMACGEPRSSDPFGASSTSGSSGTDATSGAAADATTSSSTGVGTAADDTTGDGTKLDVSGTIDLGGNPTIGCDDLEALPTNQGCEFWAVDLPNVSVVTGITAPHDQQFAVVVSNPAVDEAAQVDIFVGDEAMATDGGPVPAQTMRVFTLPAMSIPPGVTGSNGAAYRIESDRPIVAYQFQPLDNTDPVYSNDASILLPTHVLGDDYSAITGDANLVAADAFSASDTNTGAFVSVVATQDATTVSLFPTTGLHPGSFADVMLDRGEVFTAISSERGAPSWGNLSGSRVVADAPVAVFGGSVATSEPSSANACCADHVEHQLLPLTAWGTAYLASPTPAAMGSGDDASLYRITAAFDGTTLEYEPAPPPGAPTSLDAFETVSFVTDAPFTVRAAQEDRAFAIAQFLLSNNYFGGLFRPGDPSMIVLPAAAQFQDRYDFLVPQGYTTNFVTVVRPAGAAIELDGAAVMTTFASLGDLDGQGYEYAHVAVTGGSHTISADAPISIVVAGHASDVSYGYVGGSGVEAIGEPPPPPG